MKIVVAGPMTLDLLGAAGQRLAVRTSGYPFGYVAELVRAFLADGHEVVAITSATDIDDSLDEHEDGLKIFVVPSSHRARQRALSVWRSERQAIASLMRAAAPDVVHAHWTYEFGLAAVEARLPNLVTVHDWAPAVLRHQPSVYRGIRLTMQVRCLLRAGALSAPSPYVADKCRGYSRRQVDVIPNGVEASRSAPRASSSGPLRFGALNVGFGRRKNVHVLLEAWRISRLWESGCRLSLAGPGYERGGQAYAQANDLGCTEAVEWRGSLTAREREAWLDGLGVFVHPSLEESFGMVILEAMSAGLPVLGGERSGAVSWLMGEAGVTLDMRAPTVLASALRRMADDPALRKRLSVRSIARAEEFRLDHVCQLYLRKFEQLI